MVRFYIYKVDVDAAQQPEIWSYSPDYASGGKNLPNKEEGQAGLKQ